MRERTSAIYKVIAEIGINEMSDPEAAIHYAVMNLSKRGGDGEVTAKVERIQEYCKYYKEFIKKEIEIINPDVIVWLGANTYDKKLHIDYLGAKKIKGKVYFFIDDKQIPILRMWHTSYRWKGGIEPLQGYADERIGRLCAKCKEEMKRYDLI